MMKIEASQQEHENGESTSNVTYNLDWGKLSWWRYFTGWFNRWRAERMMKKFIKQIKDEQLESLLVELFEKIEQGCAFCGDSIATIVDEDGETAYKWDSGSFFTHDVVRGDDHDCILLCPKCHEQQLCEEHDETECELA